MELHITTINKNEKLFNHFVDIFNQIINITDETSIDKISSVIQEKLMFLGQKSLENIISHEIGTGFTETHITNSNDNAVYTYNELVSKTYISLFGPISLKRAYYYNKEKGTGIFPIEEKQHFLKDICLPEVKELICYAATIEPYAHAQEVLKTLSKIEVSTTEIQKTTKKIGNQLVLEEDELIKNPKKYKKSKKTIERMAISMDGARWIWDLADKEFPFAVQIVDWYHAKQHLYNIINSLYGDNKKKEAVIFAEKCLDLLYIGNIKDLEEFIRLKIIEMNIIDTMYDFMQIQTEIEYFKKNEKRMKYSLFKDKGYPIGSGIIEATCKQLVQLRLKRNGMKWKKEGAHCILQLRCHYLGNRWDEVKKIIWNQAA